MDLLDPVTDLFGGGVLTPILVAAGLVAVYLAFKVVKLVARLAMMALAAVLFVGTAPLASEDVAGPAAACAMRAVEEALSWQTVATKRITVEDVSADARCNAPEDALDAGTATVKLRTFYDLPMQTWTVTPAGASAQRFG